LAGALLVGIVVMGIATSPPIEVSGIAIGTSVPIEVIGIAAPSK
jgi:hypothetical protein